MATPEQLERLARGRETAAANRALKREEGTAVMERPAVLDARRPTANEQYLARSIGEQNQRQQPRGRTAAMQKFINQTVLGEGEELTEDDDGTVRVGAKLVHLYSPTDWGWEPVNVPYTNINMCLNAGFRTTCGDCGKNCQPDAMRPTPNTCAGREKFATMRCPICGRVIYDFGARTDGPAPRLTSTMTEADGNEGTEVGKTAYTSLGPETRLKAQMDQHLDAFHRNSALALGLVLPEDRRPV